MGTTGFYPVSSLRLELQSTQRELLQERETTATYVRGVEDRAHREVDRVREESMAVAAQMKAVSKHQEQLRQRLDTALAKLSEAQQLATAEAARAATLAQHLVKRLRAQRVSAKPAKLAKRPREPTDQR